MDMESLFQTSPEHKELFLRIRSCCLSFPGTNERISHGAPSFFIHNKLAFAQYRVNHHGDGKIALWCYAPAGVQSMLTESEPDVYFVPPYVGHLGWIGMRLDRGVDFAEIEGVLGDAYMNRAPKKYREQRAELNRRGSGGDSG